MLASAGVGAQVGGNGQTKSAKSTLCEFFSGPRSGTRGNAFPAQPIGAPCHDDAGNRGVTVSPVKMFQGPPHDQGLPAPPQHAALPGSPHVGKAAPQQPVQQGQPDLPKKYAAKNHQTAASADGAPPHAGDTGDVDDLDAGREQSILSSMEQEAKNGKMVYDVPTRMTVGEAMTVKVDLLGSNADPGSVKFTPTGAADLKISPLMEVTLSEPENPDAFTIVADPMQSGSQIVQVDGKAEWAWKVVPNQGGKLPKVLQIDAYMMLNEQQPGAQIFHSEPIRSATVSVPVSVKGFWSRAGDFLQKNWATLAGYVLPSGAGAALFVFLFNRRKSKAK
jgi:hypothetical protein